MSRIWIITGASSGLGRALAEHILEKGDHALLIARRGEAFEPLTQRYPEQAIACPADVTDSEARKHIVARTLDQFGQIDVLANIAGKGTYGAAEEFSAEELRSLMELNFFAATELSREVLPVMREQKSGHILNLTSIAGLVAFPCNSLYCASKFALEGWTEALHHEVKDFGIHVTLVEPGAFRTAFAGNALMHPRQKLSAYRAIVEPMEQYFEQQAGHQPGDPQKAASIIFDMVNSNTAPIRLMLGADAYSLWEQTVTTRNADLATWRTLGENTAYPDGSSNPVDID